MISFSTFFPPPSVVDDTPVTTGGILDTSVFSVESFTLPVSLSTTLPVAAQI